MRMHRTAWTLVFVFISLPMLAVDRVLVVTATAGFRHDSIETAESVIAEIADQTSLFEVTFVRTEEEMVQAFTAENLKSFKLVMFVNTTGELAPATRPELLRWVVNGGSFLGAHSAADTWHDSPDYIDMLGGEFLTHPAETTVEVFATRRIIPPSWDWSRRTCSSKRSTCSGTFISTACRCFCRFGRVRRMEAPAFFRWPGTRTMGPEGSCIRPWVTATMCGLRGWFRQHLTGAIRWGLERDPSPRRRAVRREAISEKW